MADKHAERQAAYLDGRCPPEVHARAAIKVRAPPLPAPPLPRLAAPSILHAWQRRAAPRAQFLRKHRFLSVRWTRARARFLRAAPQLAVYAEFRQDWRTAVQEYQSAYAHVRAVVAPPVPPSSSSGAHMPPATHSSPALHTVAAHAAAAGHLHASHSLPHVASAAPPGWPSSTPGADPLLGGAHGEAGGDAATRHAPHHAHHSSWAALQHHHQHHHAHSGGGGGGAVPAHAPMPLQRFAQAARLAELLQLKLVILLAYRDRLEEAVAQANSHIQFFSRPPCEDAREGRREPR